jgi:predicted RNA binding protein YcfA (HicA-like mRNA interferase family)
MPTSGKDLVREFERAGWVFDRQRGSHVILKKGAQTVSIPVHGNKDLPIGTEKKLRKDLESK